MENDECLCTFCVHKFNGIKKVDRKIHASTLLQIGCRLHILFVLLQQNIRNILEKNSSDHNGHSNRFVWRSFRLIFVVFAGRLDVTSDEPFPGVRIHHSTLISFTRRVGQGQCCMLSNKYCTCPGLCVLPWYSPWHCQPTEQRLTSSHFIEHHSKWLNIIKKTFMKKKSGTFNLLIFVLFFYLQCRAEDITWAQSHKLAAAK